MELRQVLADVPVRRWLGDEAAEVDDLAFDSRRAGSGTLFFCVVGSRSDGHDFAAQAVEQGASALVVERALEGLDVPQALVDDARAAMAPAAVAIHRDPTAELRVAGVTGTNGKTTTAFLLRHLLERSGTRCGLLGTVKSVVGGIEEGVERTTPEAIDLQATFRRMLDAGDRACAMEVSSHALAIGRTDGVRFRVALFTNLTQDHLDFHADMDDYFLAKRRLFLPDSGEPPETAVVNVDDEHGRRLASDVEREGASRLLTFSPGGAEGADLRALDVDFDAAGSRFRIAGEWGEAAVSLPLPGDFNVENALAALGGALALGVEPRAAAAALGSAERVPGRLEPIGEGQEFAVLVDYAHTPDSLRNVLEAARRIGERRLICVFGCGGDRDREKRPLMGEIGARLSDLAIVTSDNPRSEDPQAIIAEILAGVPGPGAAGDDSVKVVPDRRAAIRVAVEAAAPGDTVVVAGKGHEQGQELAGGRKIPFDDREVAREELRRRLAAAPA